MFFNNKPPVFDHIIYNILKKLPLIAKLFKTIFQFGYISKAGKVSIIKMIAK